MNSPCLHASKLLGSNAEYFEALSLIRNRFWNNSAVIQHLQEVRAQSVQTPP